MQTIEILWGLPGSGKTYYAEKLRDKDCVWQRANTIVSVDEILGYHRGARRKLDAEQTYSEIGRYVASALTGAYAKTVIVDSLITTNEHVRKLMKAIKKHTKKTKLEYKIIFWEKDIEACLHNDLGRRKVSSKISIENMDFEEPSQELLDEFNMQLVRKKVVRKSDEDIWVEQQDQKDGYLLSEKWSLGGTYGNCWDDVKRAVSADPPPVSFNEFDKLLEKTCPNINFLRYKRIYAETVTSETTSEGDYYGGNVDYAYYKCDLRKLYRMLNEMGLFNECS